mmetsp:Transcript_23449/g.23096  ORF Transcript_23449/g.23096 Transcript_23449/m.23096 type:complete len:84 (-) Transcript_23449:369-620(-)|eukprot:CAMPEP_0170553082 /NCGR_PEP_ID=MMETSP0211-20121228/10936_1 /TAXON_ID=311385 /ORGANISM="Pseudokeronopsis sp., Strain OXSARD2" /LENGTH=83 /DNA_ID=CAMNT_0010861211 /DNA_START=302 /DNA_END=553 /DNA_ORIENTATION=+
MRSFHENDEEVPEINSEKDQEALEKALKTLKLGEPLDASLSSQTVDEAIKHINSKIQENCNLAKVIKVQWNPEKGEISNSYIH